MSLIGVRRRRRRRVRLHRRRRRHHRRRLLSSSTEVVLQRAGFARLYAYEHPPVHLERKVSHTLSSVRMLVLHDPAAGSTPVSAGVRRCPRPAALCPPG